MLHKVLSQKKKNKLLRVKLSQQKNNLKTFHCSSFLIFSSQDLNFFYWEKSEVKKKKMHNSFLVDRGKEEAICERTEKSIQTQNDLRVSKYKNTLTQKLENRNSTINSVSGPSKTNNNFCVFV